jgi:hypothetical protein
MILRRFFYVHVFLLFTGAVLNNNNNNNNNNNRVQFSRLFVDVLAQRYKCQL